jgi:uncharacterized protein
MTKLLSASRLNDYLGCAHRAALWLAGVKPDEVVDETLELIRSKGFEHEAAVLRRLEAVHGKAVEIPTGADLSIKVAATLAAIRAGAPLIYQGALADNLWMGLPDFLVRKARADGSAIYEPEDAKLAHKAKAGHVLQLGLYAHLLESAVGHGIGDGVLHVGGGDPEIIDLRRTRFMLRRLMAEFEAFVGAGGGATRPIPCAACVQCDFKARCDAEWRAADSPYFVAGVSGAQVVKLEAAGIASLSALADAADDLAVAGMGADVLRRLRAQARLQRQERESGVHAVETLPTEPGRGFALLPPPDAGDLFFDMEGDPLFDGGLEYLFGVWGTVDGAPASFRPTCAHDRVQEKTAFEQVVDLFIRQMVRNPKAHIYHYASYEPSALKRLAMRHATREAELDQLLRERRFIDLYRVVRQGVRASTEGYSLKDLERIYWGERGGAVTTAAASVVEYERWLVSGEGAILEAITRYNEDDCVSTARMRDWLEGLRPAGGRYAPAAATEADDGKGAERARKEASKQTLASRVRASTTGDPALRELVAELLWFHQRAQKPGWWAVFEREAWSDEELIDDPESLGAVEQAPDVRPTPVKKSLLRTFRFPPQDTKLKVGQTPKIAASRAGAGTIIELSPEEGRLVLKRSAAAGEYPVRFGLIPAPLDQQGLPDAVEAFAQRFAEGRLQADGALLDFLHRRPPRLKGRLPGAPILEAGESLVPGVVRAVRDLDASALFIQGPPGTGKTYTIAAVILALLSEGFRIGVASNSHKAINKVLEEVELQAAATGASFVGAKRGREDEPETHFDSAHVRTLFKSEEITARYRLVGGTAFHFCRPDQRGAFDYLIVDEAGQVALGNLVAMAGAARNLVLVGDQMQLAQPIQGVHPGETGLSGLDYLLRGQATVPPTHGVLLNESRRMRREVCSFISEAIYEGRLSSHPEAAKRAIVAAPGAHPAILEAGVVFLETRHEGDTQSSGIEADAIATLVAALLAQKVRRDDGSVTPLTLKDILVVAPYNMQVNLLRRRLPAGAAVGTVDKFQGQQAPVVILSMTTSRGEDAPRGSEFLFSPNRINVAISRAQCLAVVVHSAELLDGSWSRIADLERLNLMAHAESIALRVSV